MTHEGYIAYIYCLKAMNLYSFLSGLFISPLATVATGIAGKASEPDAMEATVIPTGKGQMTDCVNEGVSHDHRITGVLYELIRPYPGLNGTIPQKFIKPDGADLRDLKGACFPYFDQMVNPDKDFLVMTFRHFFLKLLGNDPTKAIAVWKMLKSGLRNLAVFPAGQAISHAFMGIQLSADTGTAITFLVSNGAYHGFVLQRFGDDFRIQAHGKEITAATRVEIQNMLGSVNKHEAHLTAILRLLNEPTRIVGGEQVKVYDFKMTDIDTSRKLVSTWGSIDRDVFTRQTFDEDIHNEISELTFGDVFPQITQALILRFLEFVETGNNALLNDHPAYLGEGYYKEKGRVEVGLGIFGNRAPTISYGARTDRLISLPRRAAENDPNLLVDQNTGKRSLEYLPFKEESIINARNQWNALFANGEIRIPHGRAQKNEFTNRKITKLIIGQSPYFEQAYNRMKNYSDFIRGEIQGGKRRRGGEGERADRKKQKTNLQGTAGLMED
jgi:hypothetical protein